MVQDLEREHRLNLILIFVKVIAVLLVAAGITYLTYQFQYFEHIEEGVEYGIWHGFPLGYYFKGYHITWGNGANEMIADWNVVNRWQYLNLGIDFLTYAGLTGGILFLVEKVLKKLLKIEW